MESAPAVGKEYAGPSGIARDSQWLTSEDLPEGKDLTVRIEKVIHYPEVTFEKGRRETNMLGLKFEKGTRVLIINATNRKTLNKAFGNMTQAWKGQHITLYVADVTFGGEAMKGVRIRSQRSRAASAGEDFIAGGAGGAPEDDPKPAVAADATPLTATDAQLWAAFKALCEKATASFGGERMFVKQAPPKSGNWYTADDALTFEHPGMTVHVWDGTALRCDRAVLAAMTEALEALLA